MEDIKEEINDSAEAGIYIDFPFCIARCAFCDFNIQGFREGLAKRYESALLKEIALHAKSGALKGREIVSIYMGGGTPTCYSPETLNQIIAACRHFFNIQANAEITVEAHPATLNPPYLEAIRKGGINRLSMGVQSFSDDMLTRLGRHHSAEDVYASFRAARAAGFDHISIDLIYALPGQSREQWENTLKTAIQLDPEHISVYCLSIEEVTLFHRQGVAPLSEEEQIAQYRLAQHLLDAEGFLQYEISNFAKAGYASRHNLLYWDRNDTLGMGLSAHSYIDHEHKTNAHSLRSYCESIEAGDIPIVETRTVGIEEHQIDQIVFGLRKSEGISKTLLQHSPDRMREAASLIKAGILSTADDRIFLTPEGMMVADEVAVSLL
jgi:oxygen-independent coproporphyrinogen-3 oxidase